MNSKTSCLLASGLFAALFAGSVSAHEAGDWLVRAGALLIDPKSDNGEIGSGPGAIDIKVDDDTMFTFDVTYMFTQNWGVELLAAAPFEHDISVGGADIASTKHLPPTVSAIYNFLPEAKFQPYVGLGLNFTMFFDEDLDGGALGDPGADLSLDNSTGVAAVIGVDVDLGNEWFLNAVVRWFDIDTDGEVKFSDNSKLDLGSVEIDPWAFGVNVGRRF